jgi:hypothetical protein
VFCPEDTDGPQANASKSKHAANISLYQVSSCQIKCRRATWFRGSAPSWSCTRNRGQGAKPGTGTGPASMGASRSVGQLGPPPHHDALEALLVLRTLCLVSASWESVGRRDPTARLGGRNPHGSRPPACLPDAPNVNGKCKCTTACDSARACPALPDFFLCPPSSRVRQLTAWLWCLILASFEDTIEAADRCIALERRHAISPSQWCQPASLPARQPVAPEPEADQIRRDSPPARSSFVILRLAHWH